MIWRYNRHYIDKTPKCRKSLNMRASEASLKFSHFHILKLLYTSIFVGTSDTLSQKHIIFTSQITSAYIIQSMQFPFITYGQVWCYNYTNDSIPTNTNIKKMYVQYMRASLYIFVFLHSKTIV